jgi:hypothetical protein
MPLSKAEIDRYTTLLARHAQHPVVLDSDLGTLAIVLGAVQLALRHPRFPRASRQVVEGWLEQILAGIATLSPALADGLRAGSDPANDV